MKTYAAPAVDPAVGRAGIPTKSLRMTAALQEADLERFARMFVGLPQLAVISFTLAGASLTVHPGAPLPGRQRRAGLAATATWSAPRSSLT